MTYQSRYEDGSEVLTADGIWLHHCVFSSNTRFKSYTPLGSHILWAGGNERPTLRLNTRYKYGIDWPDTYNILFEFMSALEQPKRVFLSVSFEYIEKTQPEAADYKDSILTWFTIGNPKQVGAYDLSSKPWQAPTDGVLLHAMGHMHDGGTSVDLYINEKLACSSHMYYARRSGYDGGSITMHGNKTAAHGSLTTRDGAPGHGGFAGTHISDPGHCTSFGRVHKGDNMTIQAHYNTTKHNTMAHEGKTEEQMGIIRVFIGPD
jgi:hypothetical protein